MRYVVNHVLEEGPKKLREVAVTYTNGTELRAFVQSATTNQVALSDEAGPDALLDLSCVHRAEVHHYDGSSRVLL